MSNKKLTEDSHKPIVRKFKKIKVHSTFRDNISHADLANMQLISKFNKEIRFLLCVIVILVNVHELFLRKIKNALQLLNFFKKI